MFTMISREKRKQARGERIGTAWMFVGMVFIMASIVLGAGASGQADENAVNSECAKHGLAGYRVAWGRSRCIDKDGKLVAFPDVR
jgi:hypothetical protein